MKVSREEEEKTKLKLIEAAVQVISKKGFRDATMREIAEKAKVGDATIYKYFPTKEGILFGYFEVRLDDLIESLKGIPDFNKYSLQEQLHTLIETNLEIFAKDRAFIQVAYEGVFLTNWIAAASGSKATKERFLEIVDDLVTAAVEVGEIESPPFKNFLYELFWEYAIGITYYWLKDTSPKYTGTTQMLDKSLAVIIAAIKSNLLNKFVDLSQFLIREHILSQIKSPETHRNFDLPKLKRRFMTKDNAAKA
jgi:AcrR family transcriptional regulator